MINVHETGILQKQRASPSTPRCERASARFPRVVCRRRQKRVDGIAGRGRANVDKRAALVPFQHRMQEHRKDQHLEGNRTVCAQCKIQRIVGRFQTKQFGRLLHPEVVRTAVCAFQTSRHQRRGNFAVLVDFARLNVRLHAQEIQARNDVNGGRGDAC